MKFGRFFAEIVKRNIRKFRRVVHTEIYGVFRVKNRKKVFSKLKTERNVNREV